MLNAMALVPDVPMSTPIMYCMQGYLISIIVNNITPGLDIERMIQRKRLFGAHENIHRLACQLLIVDGYFLISSLIYFFYYLEFKRMLNKLDLMHTQINDNALLDS